MATTTPDERKQKAGGSFLFETSSISSCDSLLCFDSSQWNNKDKSGSIIVKAAANESESIEKGNIEKAAPESEKAAPKEEPRDESEQDDRKTMSSFFSRQGVEWNQAIRRALRGHADLINEQPAEPDGVRVEDVAPKQEEENKAATKEAATAPKENAATNAATTEPEPTEAGIEMTFDKVDAPEMFRMCLADATEQLRFVVDNLDQNLTPTEPKKAPPAIAEKPNDQTTKEQPPQEDSSKDVVKPDKKFMDAPAEFASPNLMDLTDDGSSKATSTATPVVRRRIREPEPPARTPATSVATTNTEVSNKKSLEAPEMVAFHEKTRRKTNSPRSRPPYPEQAIPSRRSRQLEQKQQGRLSTQEGSSTPRSRQPPEQKQGRPSSNSEITHDGSTSTAPRPRQPPEQKQERSSNSENSQDPSAAAPPVRSRQPPEQKQAQGRPTNSTQSAQDPSIAPTRSRQPPEQKQSQGRNSENSQDPSATAPIRSRQPPEQQRPTSSSDNSQGRFVTALPVRSRQPPEQQSKQRPSSSENPQDHSATAPIRSRQPPEQKQSPKRHTSNSEISQDASVPPVRSRQPPEQKQRPSSSESQDGSAAAPIVIATAANDIPESHKESNVVTPLAVTPTFSFSQDEGHSYKELLELYPKLMTLKNKLESEWFQLEIKAMENGISQEEQNMCREFAQRKKSDALRTEKRIQNLLRIMDQMEENRS